ncbi:hypothetical protein TNCV_2985391 [Trichonephila clavipes]|nr:hypothetical protein TNCV_2985391 [Trichonephila clavipes]
MSDLNDSMDFSPSRHLQVAACEKLRDTVTGISALDLSLQEKESLRSPSPWNSYIALYRRNAKAMARKKEEMESVDEFIFPKKTARPASSTSTQDPVQTSNRFWDLEQDVVQPLPTDSQVTIEEVIPKPKLPPPMMLKIKDDFREKN